MRRLLSLITGALLLGILPAHALGADADARYADAYKRVLDARDSLSSDPSAREKLQQASEDLAELVNDDGDYAPGHFGLGVALRALGKCSEGDAELNRYADIVSQDRDLAPLAERVEREKANWPCAGSTKGGVTAEAAPPTSRGSEEVKASSRSRFEEDEEEDLDSSESSRSEKGSTASKESSSSRSGTAVKADDKEKSKRAEESSSKSRSRFDEEDEESDEGGRESASSARAESSSKERESSSARSGATESGKESSSSSRFSDDEGGGERISGSSSSATESKSSPSTEESRSSRSEEAETASRTESRRDEPVASSSSSSSSRSSSRDSQKEGAASPRPSRSASPSRPASQGRARGLTAGGVVFNVLGLGVDGVGAWFVYRSLAIQLAAAYDSGLDADYQLDALYGQGVGLTVGAFVVGGILHGTGIAMLAGSARERRRLRASAMVLPGPNGLPMGLVSVSF